MESHKKIILGIIAYLTLLCVITIFLDDVLRFDNYLFFLVNGLFSPYLASIFNTITYMGSSVFWVLVIVVAWLKKKKKLSLQLIFAFAIDTISVAFLKYAFLRPRPFEVFQLDNVIAANLGPSFPSGHTERAFSGALILSSHYKKYSVLFFGLAFLVAMSRVYLGLHFPLDTLIGAVNGLIIAMIIVRIPTKNIEKRMP